MSKIKSIWHKGRFLNAEPREVAFFDFLKWRLTRVQSHWPEWVNNNITPKIEPSIRDKIKITYINHATVLIQVAGFNILTDPIWSKRASPSQWVGPKRIHAPGIKFEDLPNIDLVLISHDHFDHLDLPTVKKLEQRFKSHFMVGLKMGKYLEKIEKNIHCTELDWWDTHQLNNESDEIKVHYVPAQHWSARSLFAQNQTLWGGFVIESKAGNIYFAGDTAFGQHFEAIKKAFSSFKACLLPIGAYEPRWFMKHSHIDPEEAVQAFKILSPERAIAIHFDCFKNLADEAYGAAEQELIKELEKNHISQDLFLIPKPGQEIIR